MIVNFDNDREKLTNIEEVILAEPKSRNDFEIVILESLKTKNSVLITRMKKKHKKKPLGHLRGFFLWFSRQAVYSRLGKGIYMGPWKGKSIKKNPLGHLKRFFLCFSRQTGYSSLGKGILWARGGEKA